MELFLLLFVLLRNSATLLEPTAWTGSYESLRSGRRNVFLQKCFTHLWERKCKAKRAKSRKRRTIFQVSSPNDQYRTSNTFLTIDFLFSTSDLGGALGEVSKFEENMLSFRVVKHQDGGGECGKQG